MTVAQQLSHAHLAVGGQASMVLSHNRDLLAPGIPATYVDYTQSCPREWFTRKELAVDILNGRMGRTRPFFGHMYDPAVEALKRTPSDIVLLYEGHYTSATLPQWRPVRASSQVCLYVHNPVSRTYGRRELRRLLSHADRVIFCADHLRENVERRLGRHVPTHLETVHNGVEDAFFVGSDRQAPQDAFTVVYFGRVVPNKGVHLVLEASELAQGRSGRSLRVRVIGSAEYGYGSSLSPYEESLRRQAAKMAVGVEFLPFLARDDLLNELSSAGLACLPSTWAEGLPLTALEAMAAGLPVVCSDSPGMLEACGSAGAITKMGDAGGLADAIGHLADDGQEWRRRSQLCWSRAQSFTWDRASRRIAGMTSRGVG